MYLPIAAMYFYKQSADEAKMATAGRLLSRQNTIALTADPRSQWTHYTNCPHQLKISLIFAHKINNTDVALCHPFAPAWNVRLEIQPKTAENCQKSGFVYVI